MVGAMKKAEQYCVSIRAAIDYFARGKALLIFEEKSTSASSDHDFAQVFV